MKSVNEGKTNMIIYSGFIVMSVDKEKNNLVTPEIGTSKKSKVKRTMVNIEIFIFFIIISHDYKLKIKK